jgi:L-lactate dehydrogenase (cytochrome)
MLGRPFLWAMGAAGAPGLARFADGLAEDIGIALAQVGLRHVREIGPGILAPRRA